MRLPRRRRTRLLAALCFRDEMRYLPGLFANLAPHVDGVVALDHGSADGSREFVERQPLLLDLVDWPRERPLHEGAMRRDLIERIWHHGPDWVLGIDADERVERRFRERALAQVERPLRRRRAGYRVVIRELWDRPDAVRVDGVFGRKGKHALFRTGPGHVFDERPLHAAWPSMDAGNHERLPRIDAIVYHLRMLTDADRRARRARYERIDPDRRWQRRGYDYMTDLRGLRVVPLPAGRDYEPLP
jgi:hypothetical protein